MRCETAESKYADIIKDPPPSTKFPEILVINRIVNNSAGADF